MLKRSWLLCAALLATLAGANATEPDRPDRSEAPRFEAVSGDAGSFPLKSTDVKVKIAGTIADVSSVQTYKNEGSQAIEAVYVFPGSTRAAVYGMRMSVGGRVTEAQVREKEKAQAEYAQAKNEGKAASLLLQHRPNVFQMQVANVMPGESVKVELKYTETLDATDGEYEFVYPTVVGPRYHSGEPASPERWIANSYLSQGTPGPAGFTLSLDLAAGMPIAKMVSESHKVKIDYSSASMARVSLAPDESNPADRDFSISYRLAGDAVESGLLLSEGQENFFLVTAQPPKRVSAGQILPREYIFVVDVSGSMNGFPLDTAKRLMGKLLAKLGSADLINMVLFAGGAEVLAPQSLPATSGNLARAEALLSGYKGSGSTELLPALRKAIALPEQENFSRSIVLITDGFVTIEEEAFSYVRENLGRANLFPFGIGSSVNRFLIEGLAHAGQGEGFVVEEPSEADREATRFVDYVRSPVLTNIEVAFEGFETFDVEPLAIPDLLAERPISVFGKWRGERSGKIVISGTTSEGEYRRSFDVATVEPLEQDAALRYLWARKRIQILSDYSRVSAGSDQRAAITNLGLAYNLLTDFTSFLAVDAQVGKRGGQQTQVWQPLPLPQGVSNLALGGGRTLSYGGGGVAYSGPRVYSDRRLIAYNDMRAISQPVNGVLTYMEGALGALMMLVFGIAGIALLAWASVRRRRGAVLAGVLCLMLAGSAFALRGLMSSYFNGTHMQR